MLNYTSFIKESTTKNQLVYWNWKDMMNKNWKKITIDNQFINIVMEDGDMRQVLLEVEGNTEMLKLPVDAVEPFWKKFAIEFKKNAPVYLDDMSYVPKACGNVEPILKGKQFDM